MAFAISTNQTNLHLKTKVVHQHPRRGMTTSRRQQLEKVTIVNSERIKCKTKQNKATMHCSKFVHVHN